MHRRKITEITLVLQELAAGESDIGIYLQKENAEIRLIMLEDLRR